MHEVSLAEEILRIVESTAVEQAFSKVEGLTLEIGDLAGVEAEALEFALTHMATGTLLEGATLTLLTVPGSGYCKLCRVRAPIEFIQSPCPKCGEQPLLDLEGTELRIRDLEVN